MKSSFFLLFLALTTLSPFREGKGEEGSPKKEEKKQEKKEKKLSPAEALSKWGGVAEPFKDPSPLSSFLVMDAFIISVIHDHKIGAVLSFTPTLEFTSPSLKVSFYEKVYPIRDRIFTDLYGVLGALWLPGTDLNIEFLRKRVEKIISSYLPPRTIKKVLFQKISLHYPHKPLILRYLNPSNASPLSKSGH